MKIDFDRFESVTGYDILGFLESVKSFISTKYGDVVIYYTGGALSRDSFKELDRLVTESKKIEPLFELHKGSLNTIDFWELLDLFSDIQVKLETIQKTGKWLRSSRLGVQSESVKVDRILSQNENFESVIGGIDKQDTWRDLALSNFIEEEMYTPEGGVMFTLPITQSANIDLPTVVDYFTANNIFGKDLTQKVEFLSNDLKTVEGRDALNQSFYIKVSTFKGDIPEFPSDGISPDVVGGTYASIQYPTLIRDVLDLFKKDARWREVNIIDIYRENDSIFLKIACNSLSNDTFVNNIFVQ